MNEKTKHALLFGGTAVAGILAFIWWRKKKSLSMATINDANTAPSDYGDNANQPLTPIDYVYSSNPSNFGPVSISATVDAGLPAGLTNQYMPLFGFVGMAQTAMWQ